MTLFDRLNRRELEAADELPAQASDDELLAWGEGLLATTAAVDMGTARHLRRRPLRAEPLEPTPSPPRRAAVVVRPVEPPADPPFARPRRGRPLVAQPGRSH